MNDKERLGELRDLICDAKRSCRTDDVHDDRFRTGSVPHKLLETLGELVVLENRLWEKIHCNYPELDIPDPTEEIDKMLAKANKKEKK